MFANIQNKKKVNVYNSNYCDIQWLHKFSCFNTPSHIEYIFLCFEFGIIIDELSCVSTDKHDKTISGGSRLPSAYTILCAKLIEFWIFSSLIIIQKCLSKSIDKWFIISWDILLLFVNFKISNFTVLCAQFTILISWIIRLNIFIKILILFVDPNSTLNIINTNKNIWLIFTI